MNVNATMIIGSLVFWGPKKFKLALPSRRVKLSGNTSLIATFSSLFLFTVQHFELQHSGYDYSLTQ